jgi:hypothetical protein
MRGWSLFSAPLPLSAGAALAAYGGYGVGVGHAVGAGLGHWLQAAAVVVTALGLFGYGLWRLRCGKAETGSLAADLAALERLVPTVRHHPQGLEVVQDLIDVLFEARHRPSPARRPASQVAQGGRHDG